MKKKISFRMWLSVFFGGIWQFICNIFSWKNKTPFWRVIWATITICILAFTCMLGYAFYDEFVRKSGYRYSWEERYDSNLSPYFKYRNNGNNEGKSYIYDSRTKKKMIKDIDWIAVPEDGDSLIIVAKGGKRGFVNRYTAETVIPFKYDAAWSFTDGVAGVCEGDSVWFIDHSGKPIHNRKFARKRGYDRYVYHGDYAAIPINGRYGLLDKKGEWAILPEHEDIHIGARNMWYAMDNKKWGVVGTNGQFVIPMEYENVWIHTENGITVAKADHSQSRYDYAGSLIDEFVFDEVSHLAYYINEFDKDGNQKQAIDNGMLKYSANNFYGLMSKDGTPVTPPLYEDIEAVTPGVYQCHIPETYECIMVNSKGEKSTTKKTNMKQRVFNLLILDESGSMSSIEEQAIGAVNETIQTIRSAQKKHEDQEHFMSLVVFNSDEVRTVYDSLEIGKIEELSSEKYQPSSCTPLYDAMGNALTALKRKVAETDSVLVTVVTDGYENASKEYDGASIKALVDSLKEKGWLFAYIGANQDAEKVGRTMGIRSTLNFSATCEGTAMMGATMGTMIGRVAHCLSRPMGKNFLADADLFDDSLDDDEE